MSPISTSGKRPARLVAGIDPGLASGGFAVVDRSQRERVLAAFSLGERSGATQPAKAQARTLVETLGGWSDIEFLAVDIRARNWMTRFIAALEAFEAEYGQIDVFAVESFVDQRQHAHKMMINRWHTPLLTGMLISFLTDRGITPTNGRLIYQDSGRVLTQFRSEIDLLKSRRGQDRDMVVPNDRLIAGEHQRSALAHALALSLRLPPVAESFISALPNPTSSATLS